MRPATKPAGIIMLIYCLVSVAYISVNLALPQGNEFWKSGTINAFMLLSYQKLFILLTFALALMINRRLLSDLELELALRERTEEELSISEEKFSRAFQTSPYATAITRLEDGSFIEVNEAFLEYTGNSSPHRALFLPT